MEQNNNPKNEYLNLKINKKILMLAAMAVVLVVIIGIIVVTNLPGNRIKRYLSLGEKYMAELKYEDAIAAFDKVLDIDPKHEAAEEYEIDAYTAWAKAEADKGSYEQAVKILNSGSSKFANSTLPNQIVPVQIKWADSLYDSGDSDGAVKVLTDAYEVNMDERLSARMEDIEEELEEIAKAEKKAREEQEREEKARKRQEEKDKHTEDEFKAIYSDYIAQIRTDKEHKDNAIRNIQLYDAGNDGTLELFMLWRGLEETIEEVYHIDDGEVERIFCEPVDGYSLWLAEDEEGDNLCRITDKEGIQYVVDGEGCRQLFMPIPDGSNAEYQYLVSKEYAEYVKDVYERAKETESSDHEGMLYITAEEMEEIWNYLLRHKSYIENNVIGLYITDDMSADQVFAIWDEAWRLAWHYWYGDVDYAEIDAAEISAMDAEIAAYNAYMQAVANAKAKRAAAARLAALQAIETETEKEDEVYYTCDNCGARFSRDEMYGIRASSGKRNGGLSVKYVDKVIEKIKPSYKAGPKEEIIEEIIKQNQRPASYIAYQANLQDFYKSQLAKGIAEQAATGVAKYICPSCGQETTFTKHRE